MDLINKLTIKNLKLNKKRTIVTIIGIMLSVALITAVSSMYMSVINSLIQYEIKQQGNFHVVYYQVPFSTIETFKNNRGIDEYYITKDIGYAKLDNSKNEYKPYAYVKGFTKSALNNLSIILKEGRLPENENEILIPTHLKTNGRIESKVGDEITLDIGDRVLDNEILVSHNPYQEEETLENKKEKTYKIVGIIERPATSIEPYECPGFTFVTLINEDDIDGNVNLYTRYSKDRLKDYISITSNILGIKEKSLEIMLGKYNLTSDKEFEEANSDFASAKYNIDVNTYLIDLQINPLNNSTTGDLSVVVMIVCLIIVFTSVFCIKNSFDISITEKIKQYGMLRSMGATKKQIRKNVFYEATILGIIGIILGILLGLFATYILVLICNYYFTVLLSENLKFIFSLSWIAMLVSVILGIITIYLSAIKSAYKASKISPIDSIRNSGDIKIKSRKMKSPKLINKVFGMGGDISYKNLKRNRKKYRTTTISIIVSVSVFVALSSFMSLAFRALKEEINFAEYNLSLSIGCNDEICSNKAISTTKLDYIDRYTISKRDSIKLKDFKLDKLFKSDVYNNLYDNSDDSNEEEFSYLVIQSVGDAEYRRYINELGLKYDNVKDKAILIDIKTFDVYNKEDDKVIKRKYEVYDYSEKDKIKFETSIDNKEDEIEIVKVTDIVPFAITNEDNCISCNYVILSDELFDKISDVKYPQYIYYETNNADELQDTIDKELNGHQYYVNNRDESYRMMNNLFTLIGIFLYGFIIVISLIGITNIFNTITTSVHLRRREFAMLKSVGMTKREFNRMIRLESLFMGTKSLLFGIPIGIILSYLIYIALGKDAGLSYLLPIKAIIISVLAVFLLITIIMKYSINKINKQNIIETIRNENI